MEHISIKEIGQIIKQNRFWLGIIGLLDLLSILLLWLMDAQAFYVIAISVILFSLLVFVTAVFYLAKKERKRKKAFDEFLAMPDSYHEEQLLHDAENLQAEIRSFSQVLHEQMDQCAQTKLQLNDYEEYVEAWAHEVKTPLALLTFMLDNHRDELSEDVVCKLDRINCQMLRYIDQMLYYARLKGARKDYRFESVDTENCVKEVLEDFTPLLEEQKIQVWLDIKENTLFTDKRGFAFMLGQFISNSIKYSKGKDKQLRISCIREHEKIILSVRDNGMGIKACDLPYVFEKGFTGDSGDRRKKATGMGLYLAKEMAHDLNVELDIFSDADTGGCEIRVYFPVVTASDTL